MSSTVPSYGKIYAIGRRETASLFSGPVVVQEKVDGSQFSFGVYGGEVRARSKGKDQHLSTDKMFEAAMATVLDVAGWCKDGYTYRGEYLARPKHNVLPYDRVPNRHIVVYDISTADGTYLPVDRVRAEAAYLGLEYVPVLFEGQMANDEATLKLLSQRSSFLGGPQIEGVVVKNYAQFDPTTGDPLRGKYVRDDFKEQHSEEWKNANPSMSDIRDSIARSFQAPARFQKAVQRLRDDGRLTGTPKDIGPLMKELARDLEEEQRSEVAEALMQWAWPHIVRKSSYGFPEWYLERLKETL